MQTLNFVFDIPADIAGYRFQVDMEILSHFGIPSIKPVEKSVSLIINGPLLAKFISSPEGSKLDSVVNVDGTRTVSITV